MFLGISFNQKDYSLSPFNSFTSESEDDHYDEYEDSFAPYEDGIGFDDSIIDEYDEYFDDETEGNTPDNFDFGSIRTTVDDLEDEHYDILEDEDE